MPCLQKAIFSISRFTTSFLADPSLLSFHGFTSEFLTLNVLLAGFRALIPKNVIEVAVGRPLFIVNFSQAERSTFYGGSPTLAKFREFLLGGQENSDQIMTCYHSNTGDIKVNEEFGQWGMRSTEARPVYRLKEGKRDWKSDVAVTRHHLGCSGDNANEFSYKQPPQDKVSLVLDILRFRYGYSPESEGTSGTLSLEPRDDEQYSAESICNFFEERCASDQEKAAANWAIFQSSKTINILQLKNRTHNDVSNIAVHIGAKAYKSGKVIESVARAEGFEIISEGTYYTHLIVRSLPAGSSRFLIIEARGGPLEKGNFKVEAGITTKFGPSTFRWIAAIAFVICLGLAAATYVKAHSSGGNPAAQSISQRDGRTTPGLPPFPWTPG